MRFVLVGAILLFASACTEPRSERCKTVCEREAECAEKAPTRADFRFDEQECVSACAALERDTQGKEYVRRHADCVQDAGSSCAAVYACNVPYDDNSSSR